MGFLFFLNVFIFFGGVPFLLGIKGVGGLRSLIWIATLYLVRLGFCLLLLFFGCLEKNFLLFLTFLFVVVVVVVVFSRQVMGGVGIIQVP